MLGLVGLILPVQADESRNGSKPRVVIYHYPARGCQGFVKWDCPVFAAYGDGTVIWRRGWLASLEALAITQNQSTEMIIQKAETSVATYSGRTFVLTGSSDPDETTLWANGQTLTILGDWQKARVLEVVEGGNDAESITRTNAQEHKLWASLPAEVRMILASLKEFDAPGRSTWHPKQLMLLLQPPIITHRDKIVWPAEWPQTFAPAPNNTAMKQIELPGRMLDEVLAKIPNDGESKAILLGDEIRYAELRLVFPGIKPGVEPKALNKEPL